MHSNTKCYTIDCQLYYCSLFVQLPSGILE
uniref:Uncharacterized protein n=1 Tax=Arundo donax TaxID=35708 RepID=A0A0A8Y7S3_ARUDO